MADRAGHDDGLEPSLAAWLLRRSLSVAAGSLLACGTLAAATLALGMLGGLDAAGRTAALVFVLSCWSFAAPLVLGSGRSRGDSDRLPLRLPGVATWMVLLRGLGLSLGPAAILIGALLMGALSPLAALGAAVSLTAVTVTSAALTSLFTPAMGGLAATLLALAVLGAPTAGSVAGEGLTGRVMKGAGGLLIKFNVSTTHNLKCAWPNAGPTAAQPSPSSSEPLPALTGSAHSQPQADVRDLARGLICPRGHWPLLPALLWGLLASALLVGFASRRAFDVYIHGI